MNRDTYNDIIVPMMQHIQELEERIRMTICHCCCCGGFPPHCIKEHEGDEEE